MALSLADAQFICRPYDVGLALLWNSYAVPAIFRMLEGVSRASANLAKLTVEARSIAWRTLWTPHGMAFASKTTQVADRKSESRCVKLRHKLAGQRSRNRALECWPPQSWD
jgi:hypothetical protein